MAFIFYGGLVKETFPFVILQNESNYNWDFKENYNVIDNFRYVDVIFQYFPIKDLSITIRVKPPNKQKIFRSDDYFNFWNDLPAQCRICYAKRIYTLGTSLMLNHLSMNYIHSKYFNKFSNLLLTICLNYNNLNFVPFNVKCNQKILCPTYTSSTKYSSYACRVYYPFNSVFPHLTNSHIPYKRSVHIQIESTKPGLGICENILFSNNNSALSEFIDKNIGIDKMVDANLIDFYITESSLKAILNSGSFIDTSCSAKVKNTSHRYSNYTGANNEFYSVFNPELLRALDIGMGKKAGKFMDKHIDFSFCTNCGSIFFHNNKSTLDRKKMITNNMFDKVEDGPSNTITANDLFLVF